MESPKPARWLEQDEGAGSQLDLGAMVLSVTDQTDRGCGWCWHVNVEHSCGRDEIAGGSGLPDTKAAKCAAESWVRKFCEQTLTALILVGSGPQQN